MTNRNVMTFSGQGLMERNMALIGVAQLDTKQHFFVTCAEGDLGWSCGQAVGFYKLCRFNFKDETHKG
jgi:hypothetical protein